MSEIQVTGVSEPTVSVASQEAVPSKLSAVPKKKRKSGSSPIWNVIPYVLFFVVWEAFSRINEGAELFNPRYLPSPSSLLSEGWYLAQTGLIWDSVAASTVRILLGFAYGAAAAIALAVLIVKFRQVERWLNPVLSLLSPIPSLALLPLFIIWFGIGEFPKILLIAWTTMVPVLVNTVEGFKSVPSTLIRSALSLGASQRQIFTRILIPSAVPNLLIGAQIALGLPFGALIVAEMMGADSGLGYMIVDARNYFKIPNIFVAIILIGIEYSLFSAVLKILERRVLAWRKGGLNDAVEK